jgi:hypothetical protein
MNLPQGRQGTARLGQEPASRKSAGMFNARAAPIGRGAIRSQPALHSVFNRRPQRRSDDG